MDFHELFFLQAFMPDVVAELLQWANQPSGSTQLLNDTIFYVSNC